MGPAADIESARAEDVIALLGLAPHPEGGFYREIFRDAGAASPSGRAASTAIYFLLPEGAVSHWHRVDAAEVWHHYAGAPLALSLARQEEARKGSAQEHHILERHVLGRQIARGEQPQVVVPAHVWQSAASLGGWTLTGCTVAPGFEFASFEIAPAGWAPRG